MNNRLATLSTYTVPKGLPGRVEATQVGRSRKNLILTLYDLTQGAPQGYEIHDAICMVQFCDEKSLFERTAELAEAFGGTHSRRTGSDYDDASFRLQQRNQLIVHLSEYCVQK